MNLIRHAGVLTVSQVQQRHFLHKTTYIEYSLSFRGILGFVVPGECYSPTTLTQHTPGQKERVDCC